MMQEKTPLEIKEMMASMGMNPNGKFDMKGMANKMQQNMKRMQIFFPKNLLYL